MAKNRTSKPNVLAGLANLQARPEEPIIQNNEAPTVVTQEEIPNVETKEEVQPFEIKEEVKPVIEAGEVIKKVAKKNPSTKDANKFTVYLNDEQYLFLKKNGWEFNGMNGFIKHLIDEEKKRRGE